MIARRTRSSTTGAFYAATRCLEIISEACRRLPDDLTGRYPMIDWRAIKAAGNIYRHEYEGVEERIVWTTIRDFLGDLEAAVRAELNDLTG
ncbi:HepT-like ribonuclease domain-containing protein [uncultured Caulobacter sp.]|uniref:HepT-like ribonuclease domain-containing protein n=1 Tax=uncultured Caulobacter sp. TaxID=158749 RepID=UPI00260244E3|nr:HepT-like ribonuclease domain-containing protein [uncultured Caulobacter sp.]